MVSMIRSLTVALALCATAAAQAGPPSYSFVQVDYQVGGEFLNFVGIPFAADGYGAKGSFAVTDALFVDVGYASTTYDLGFGTGELTYERAHFGWHGESVYAKLGYERIDDDFFAANNGSGLAFELGYRTLLSDGVEFNGRVGLVDAGDIGNVTRFGIGAAFTIAGDFALTLDFAHQNFSDFGGAGNSVSTEAYGFGARYSF